MEKIGTITEEQKKYAIDLMAALVSEELSDRLNIEPAAALNAFIASKIGALLYDEESGLWGYGPSYIVELYLKETNC